MSESKKSSVRSELRRPSSRSSPRAKMASSEMSMTSKRRREPSKLRLKSCELKWTSLKTTFSSLRMPSFDLKSTYRFERQQSYKLNISFCRPKKLDLNEKFKAEKKDPRRSDEHYSVSFVNWKKSLTKVTPKKSEF